MKKTKQILVLLIASMLFISMSVLVSAVRTYGAHYVLNSDSTDSSGNGEDGSDTSISYVAGKINNAASFDGANSLITVTSTANMDNMWDGGGSISVWLYIDSDGEASHADIASKSNWQLSVVLNSKIEFRTVGGSIRTTSAALGNGAWVHYVITYTSGAGTTPLMYVNGVSVANAGGTGSPGNDGGIDLSIGNNLGQSETFDGEMDDMRFYNSILNQSDVDFLYNSGTGTEADTPISAPPGYTGVGASADSVILGNSVIFQANLTDDTNLDYFIFEHNMSGTPVNSTITDISGTDYKANVTIITNNGVTFYGKFFFNDTDGLWNQTTKINVTVNVTPQSLVAFWGSNRSGTFDKKIKFYDGGNANFSIIAADDYLTNTRPSYSTKEDAYRYMNKIDLTSIDSIHETRPPECSDGSLLCMINHIVLTLQEINIRLQRIENLLFDNLMLQEKKIHTLDTEANLIKIRLNRVETFTNVTGNSTQLVIDNAKGDGDKPVLDTGK